MGSGAAMGTTPRRGIRNRVGATALLLRRVASAAHAGPEGLVVARLALSILAGPAVGRATDAARRGADRRACTCGADRRSGCRAERRARQRTDGQADACAFRRARRWVPPGLLLGPGLALARVLCLLLGRLALGRIGEDSGRGWRGRAARERRGEHENGHPCNDAMRCGHGNPPLAVHYASPREIYASFSTTRPKASRKRSTSASVMASEQQPSPRWVRSTPSFRRPMKVRSGRSVSAGRLERESERRFFVPW